MLMEQYNSLTGLLYNLSFIQKAGQFIQDLRPNTYCMIAIDIEHFRLFNKLYGRESGDKLLQYISNCLKEMGKKYTSVSGYLGGDNFAIVMPDMPDAFTELKDEIIKGVRQWNNTVGFLPALGVYPIDDISIAPEIIYDRATTALSHVMNKYTNRICYYNSSMETDLEQELILLAEIQTALENDEFTFYAQPQCDISTGKIVGAESLVRWQHSTKGIVPPGIFIPVLEKNGLIADLDRHVWRKVFEWLRSWIDRGYRPVPISINVSRIDIFSMDVAAYLLELLHTYDLSEKLIKVEITESAYTENNQTIDQTVQELRNHGFIVMMDDFGCGYSSLNMLRNITVDVLKLDMRFLDINEHEKDRGIGILESVVNMARLMQLPIIVEGVETQDQERFLLNMGCRYTQGYYYYKPLPIAQFEELLTDERRLDFTGLWCKQVDSLHTREFLDNNFFTDSMVNNIIGPVAFYEMYDNRIEVTRINEQYYRLAGIPTGSDNSSVKRFWNHIRDDDRPTLFAIFEQAYENPVLGADGFIHFLRMDGKVLWVYLRVFFLKENEGKKLFYSSLVDMTDQHVQKKPKENVLDECIDLPKEHIALMETYYGHVPYAYGIAKIIADENERAYDFEIAYANPALMKNCDNDLHRLKLITWKSFEKNKEETLEKVYRAAYYGEMQEMYVYSSISSRYLLFTFYQYAPGYVACILRDFTQEHIQENALNSILLSYREVYFVHLQDNYCRMIYPNENQILERGNYEEIINRHFYTGKILDIDEENVHKFLSLDNLRDILRTQNSTEYVYRRSTKGLSNEWCQTSFIVSERDDEGSAKTAVMVIRSIDTIMRESEDTRRQRMVESLANMSDGFFIYQANGNQKILYANPKVLELYGCETVEEFRNHVNRSFRGMVHPEDLARIEWEINDQIITSEQHMDFIQYRIIRKDGEVRWIDDYGHLEPASIGAGGDLFYVFITDVTDTISTVQKNKLLSMNKYYQEQMDKSENPV